MAHFAVQFSVQFSVQVELSRENPGCILAELRWDKVLLYSERLISAGSYVSPGVDR